MAVLIKYDAATGGPLWERCRFVDGETILIKSTDQVPIYYHVLGETSHVITQASWEENLTVHGYGV